MLSRSILSSVTKLQQRHQALQASLAPIGATTSSFFSSQSKPSRRKSINSSISTQPTDPVRLSKRMSELGICSRREAAKILKDTTDAKDLTLCEQAIYLRGEPVTAGTGVKVPYDEQMIEIRSADDLASNTADDATSANFVSYDKLPWEKIQHDTIVLHKPVGYVSGQEEHQHVPAVRLLTPLNYYDDEDSYKSDEAILNKSGFNFTRKKWDGFDIDKSSVPKHIKKQLGVAKSDNSNKDVVKEERTLSGYAPAGRLDIDSTGLLIFTRAGIMARQLIAPDTKIPKEYIVQVQPARQPTAREISQDLHSLPPPTSNLEPLLRGGRVLHNDTKPLKPLKAKWLNSNTLKLVLHEGKKRQIRRMCREILGLHVVSLVRTSIGPVFLGTLPEGKWRPLRETEVRKLFNWDNKRVRR
ncbi:hypothetical protein ACHAXN_000888 [Cyclotella atomus]